MNFFFATFSFCIPSLFCFAAQAQTNPWKGPAAADQLKNPFENNSTATEKGKKIFFTICFACHGDKGKGDGIGAAALNPKPANFTSANIQNQTDGALFWKLTNGRGQMVSYKTTLSDEQRWQLVNFVRVLGKGGKK
jgi:mono/diheme cytochrome c family protein